MITIKRRPGVAIICSSADTKKRKGGKMTGKWKAISMIVLFSVIGLVFTIALVMLNVFK